ncbi:trimeric intracellular cation channel family protein [Chitinibacter bivalviorum]|uniref:Trimeric intracellular cation channel family protein n=1 Tax=Chitinibacter bivalviorum TaxID=2739434 RepID=A0A7H9BP42_9NEIS|nr:trimeric intracellular cation channel family protein [Chitinibacter bivalviorum]
MLPEFTWLYLIGTASFTISGYLIGAKKHYDVLGVVILALLTAIGGGMIRDVLVNQVPRVFIDNGPFLTIFVTLALAWVIKLHQKNQGMLRKLFIVADSVGLVAFSIAGAQVAMAMDLNLFGVCVLAFVTAVGGGLVRDMMVNDVPFILHEDFYGTVSILVAVLFYFGQEMGLKAAPWVWLLFLLGLGLRLVAHWRDLSLPKVKPDHAADPT